MSGISKPRTLKYTGCWTCKARKVRCDERRSTCGNCSRRGIACGGYEIKLQWMEDSLSHRGNVATSINHGRSSIKLDKSGGRRYGMEEIDNFLIAIDNNAQNRLPSNKGPFSLFPIWNERVWHKDGSETSHYDDTDERQYHFSDNATVATILSTSNSTDNSPQSELDIPSSTNAYWTADIPTELLLGDKSNRQTSNINDPELVGSCEDNAVGHSTTSEIVVQSPYMTSTDLQRSIQHVRSSFFKDAEVDELMHHYIGHVADVLQPIQHPQNPYRGLYVPSALEGALIYVSDPKAAGTNIKVAVYHAIMASAAFHLWNCDRAHYKYKEMGAQHKWHALHVLQAAVNSPISKPDYRNLLLAMLSLLTVGVISGEDDDFVVHLNGTKQLRNLRRRWKLVSGPTRQLNKISSFLILLARTLSFKTSPSPWINNENELSCTEGEVTAHVAETGCSFEHMYGITPKIAAALEETCRLAEILERRNSTQENTPVPDNLLDACEALGDFLLSWTLESEKTASLPVDDDTMLSIFKHHAAAWHYATLIYYYRRIQGYESADLEQEIQHVIEHMNSIEDIKAKSSAHSTTALAPITWPVFIASCDSTRSKREVCEKWWDRVQHYGIANIRKQWEVVQKVWTIQDEMQDKGLGLTNWMDVFRELKINLLPV